MAICTGPVKSWTRKRKASSRPTDISPAMPRYVPATTTSARTRLATSTPLENTRATRFCARTIAARVAATAASIRRCVRSATPYARMVSAPTTASEMAPSIPPTRSRTAVYRAFTRFCSGCSSTNSGTKPAHTIRVSCHE